jgi:hypothetical protein
MRKWLLGMILGATWLTLGAATESASAADTSIGRFSYYPYYYFPHNYWPTQGPQWPERPGMPYMRPPAYMAYPAFHEPGWRYEMSQPQRYHRGSHFWLDQF